MVLWSLGMCFNSNAGFSFPPSLSYCWSYSQRLELWITAKIMCSLRKNYPVGVLDVSISLKQKTWQNLHHIGESKIDFLNKKTPQEPAQRDKFSITQYLGVWKGVFVVNSEYFMSHDKWWWWQFTPLRRRLEEKGMEVCVYIQLTHEIQGVLATCRHTLLQSLILVPLTKHLE